MKWKFWQRNRYERLSDRLRRSLKQEFDLTWEALDQMRCTQHQGQSEESSARYIQVLDPVLLADGQISLQDGELTSHADAILFEVRVEEDGAMYVTDKRSAVAGSEPQDQEGQS